jgi:hypothetical protein
MSLEALIQFFSPFINNHQKENNWSSYDLKALASSDLPMSRNHVVQSNAILAQCTWRSQRMVA